MPRYVSPDGNLEIWDEKPKGYYDEEEWATVENRCPMCRKKLKKGKCVNIDCPKCEEG